MATGKTKASADADDSKSPPQRRESMRDTVESVAIAFILAFVFKTFQAEAYVIPTGSMAPTLYGRHKDHTCSACGHDYAIGASHEVDQASGLLIGRVQTSRCPNCRHIDDVLKTPVFNGDRILVNKNYEDYKRFEVVVFKNPEEPHVNYIKRLIGLPGEMIRIRDGDIQARNSAEDPWRTQRKQDPAIQAQTQLLVYDDTCPPTALLDGGWEERWTPADPAVEDGSIGGWLKKDSDAWSLDRDQRVYSVQAEGATEWLRYRHLVPGDEVWEQAVSGGTNASPSARLISDVCGFNAYDFRLTVPLPDRRSYNDERDGDAYWVGDLTINSLLSIQKVNSGGVVAFELTEGYRKYLCELSPESGEARILLIDRVTDRDGLHPQLLSAVQTPVQGTGEWQIAFANVDDRLGLWVDGEWIDLGDECTMELQDGISEPTQSDLCPVGIGFRNVEASVAELVLERDIYYRNDVLLFFQTAGATPQPQYPGESPSRSTTSESLQVLGDLLPSPTAWADQYRQRERLRRERYGELLVYTLDDDEYLMFGDNSPASKDGRLFDYYQRPLRGDPSHRYAVKEKFLIGKAIYIFWPHAVPFLNGGQGFGITNHQQLVRSGGGTTTAPAPDYPWIRFPFYPNIFRMKRIY